MGGRCLMASFALILTSCLLSPGRHAIPSSEIMATRLQISSPSDKPALLFSSQYRAIEDRHSSAAFAPDMMSVYWTESNGGRGLLHRAFRTGNTWSEPEPFRVAGRFFDCDDPVFSPDGQYFYFTSHRPHIRALNLREKIWRVDIIDGNWRKPKPLPMTVNGLPLHWQFSVMEDYSIYLGAQNEAGNRDIYFVECVNGEYQDPYPLGESINTKHHESTPFIDPKGRYLVFSRNGDTPYADLYICYRKSDGRWDEPVALGNEINTHGHELCPRVTPDGNNLLYLGTSSGLSDIWWVSFDPD